MKKKVDVFALSIYGLVVFPKALGHVDEAELVATPRRDDIFEEKWMSILHNLQVEDVEWRALWMIPDEILYWCGEFDWIPLLRIWGAIGYTPLLVLRQYQSSQFIPVTQGLAQYEFSYKGDNYKKKVCEILNA
ncbi:hypothetical protein CXB51_024628 [Gossypium anomalum]|uniref:DUF7745 domain-containing protein n=1 Tax=Gossypium anomalum TaxID=47600 RepID=A0A8J5Y2Z5_9ROSI|nr:hypothetical protein CXB51_024628 [Gossypium anomalum]